ncbi:hypothetical protein [Kitasatospora sp. NPDC008115]|uniref:hypothetical protein n=1 Tax=Kitasatospora sp. NPDC008115 TaxID=3364022 RepID=UPI0036F06ED9
MFKRVAVAVAAIVLCGLGGGVALAQVAEGGGRLAAPYTPEAWIGHEAHRVLEGCSSSTLSCV